MGFMVIVLLVGDLGGEFFIGLEKVGFFGKVFCGF